MKKELLIMIVLFISLTLKSQEMLQQSSFEFDEMMSSGESFVCQATKTIKLLPGFGYAPENDKSMVLKIDRYSVFPPADGYTGGSSTSDDGVVGSLPGSFNVSGTGAAVYSIDLDLPKAAGTLMPKLSLVYNSQSGNGIMGWSWTLSGLSMIERIGQTEYHDGKITDIDFVNDRFVIDGQRLMLVCGTYGNDKSEYKTEVDNMDKIVCCSNSDTPESFVVMKSDGTIWEYGKSPDSKLESQTDNDIILRWSLNKVSDRLGNSIVFCYKKDFVKGESYIDRIEYTTNENAGVDPAYKVLFRYESKQNDASFEYINGNVLSESKLLVNIEVVNNYSGKSILNYALDYYLPGIYEGNNYIYHRLKSVTMSSGDEKINPTRVRWNAKKEHFPTDDKFKTYQLDKSVFSNVPFVGDFNGDGFSDVLVVPYKIQNTYPNAVDGKVYLNNGDGTFQDNPMTTIKLTENLEWVYVFDIDGDCVDDIISYELNYDAQDETDGIVALHFYLMRDGQFVKIKTLTYENGVILLPGKYFQSNKNELVILGTCSKMGDDLRAEYVRANNDNIVVSIIHGNEAVNGCDAEYVSVDISGDGMNEVLALYKDGYKVYKLVYKNGFPNFVVYDEGNSMTNDIYPFPNDFNGDGKTDMLYYHPSRHWNIVFSDGKSFKEPASCSGTYLLSHVVLNPKDRYRYSLKEVQKPTVTIRTADFDGDGASDVGVFKNMAGNYYLEIGFKPYVKSDNKCCFVNESRYYMPINYSHQTIQIGRFLAQENASILSALPRNPYYSQNACIASLYSHAVFYGVEKIIDGLGNVKGFTYDYLMQKNNHDGFYTCSHYMVNDIRRKSMPILALKSDVSYNINDKPVVNRYEYRDALVHTKGHGFMGFQEVVVRTYVNGNMYRKRVSVSEVQTMGSYCMILPSYTRLYRGENYLLEERFMQFDKYACVYNDKVVMPLLKYDYEIVYSPDKQESILNYNITRNEYQSDNSSVGYKDVVNMNRSVKGYANYLNAFEPEDCLFVKDNYVKYDDNVEDWIINRPKKVYSMSYGKDLNIVGKASVFEYHHKYPTMVIKEIMLPNYKDDYSDSLMMSVEYQYDKVGNVVEQIKSSPSFEQKRVVKYEYDESCQYIIKTIDELGREIISRYDDYGRLTTTVDFNDYETYSEESVFGVDDKVTMPDGTQYVKSIRWTENHELAPNNAAYYQWEKSTGTTETMTFYHKSGCVLRTVSFDMEGKAVMVDKIYDDFGNMTHESLPYRQDEDKLFVRSVFDENNRVVETIYPNGLTKKFAYDGNESVVSVIDSEGRKRSRKDVYNVLGLLTSTKDYGGNEIIYEYYSDGLVKSAYIANNPNTRITVTYDNCRNKKTLYDPNYGTIKYEYDALGNIKKIVNPKDALIEFEYDVLGRMISKVEKDVVLNEEFTTMWVYDEERGRQGLLKGVNTSGGHCVSYEYDDKFRMVSKTEFIDGNQYETLYSYDAANRVTKKTYPSGLVISKVYSNSGYEKEVYDAENNSLLWRTNKTCANGAVAEYQVGNGLKTKVLYDNRTSLVENIRTFNNEMEFQNLNYKYDDYGNMIVRGKTTDVMTLEEFEYDGFDRLVGIRLNGKETGRMVYDELGNIMEKEVNGVSVIYGAQYDRQRPNAIIKVKTADEQLVGNRNQRFEYSSFEDLIGVVDGDDVLTIDYGLNHNRIKMRTVIAGRMRIKTYLEDCELVESDGEKTMLTYLEGPDGVFAVCVMNDNSKTFSYIHKDNLGSWNVVTGENGELLQELSFDAWGNVRNSSDWSFASVENKILYDRGFTGHEHLSDFGLINMNGRVYDPLMSMMLSPDNNIQMPQMSQNFNRYNYCMNNPLRYTDSSGEFVESVAFGVAGGFFNVIMNAGNVDSFREGALLFGVGFAKGFLTEYTAGQSWLLQVGIGTLMEGLSSGVNMMVSVGDGSFEFTGDDWNSIKSATYYGLGSGLVESFMYSYTDEPTSDQYGLNFFGSCSNKELAHSVIALAAHGMGCWFSGQPMLKSMGMDDVGFDLKMLGIIANKILSRRVCNTEFPDEVMKKRGEEIRNSILNEILSEDPDCPDFEYTYEVKGVFFEDSRLYIVGDVFALIPGEVLEYYPKPFLEEIVTFPFSYSLFKTLFFNKP